MASLPDSFRRRLENTVVKARDEAEDGARAALQRLAVGLAEPFANMSPADIELRTKLRAHARQLGDPRKANGEQEIEHLVSECAYEHWHRMLFARFLAENQLLIHSDHDVPVTLAECEELAAEAGVEDGWTLAARFAARMLPAIFRPDDPVLSVRLAPEHQQSLERLLAGLPSEVFTADDSLGWVYQFWQSKRKKEVNKSGRKIGAAELPAVTQLFTESYMVQFLLHNTLGAWWAGKVLSQNPELAITATNEGELRTACSTPGYEWSYLRFIRSEDGGPWQPAAGTFESWPDQAAYLTVLDPCCGSGHFLVEAFRILVSLRRTDEGLSISEACEAVLSDNLFGLEVDERCTQIAAFNLALAAWSYPGAGGYRPLPKLHIACSGLSVGAREEDWLRIAGKDNRLRQGMKRLYYLFQDAPVFGSLIDPRQELEPAQQRLDGVTFDGLEPLLSQALKREEVRGDAQAIEAGIAAQGMATAAALLTRSFTLVATNVPYLGRLKQSIPLRAYLEENYKAGMADLATAFVMRSLSLCSRDGVIALVTPENWLLQSSYTAIRKELLGSNRWRFVVALGEEAWQYFGVRGPRATLVAIGREGLSVDSQFLALDASGVETISEKIDVLRAADCRQVLQQFQYRAPDHRVAMIAEPAKVFLSRYADSLQGLSTADNPCFHRQFWEVALPAPNTWLFIQGATSAALAYGGKEAVIGLPALETVASELGAAIRGRHAWNRSYIAVRQMRSLYCTLSTGSCFDTSVAALVPKNQADLLPLYAFCSSPEFAVEVRKLEKKNNVTNATFAKVPFDLSYWQRMAAEKYPNGLPDPESDDPTQWLFHGCPEASTAPLQVALARLLGYCWPAELDETMRLSHRARQLVRRAGELLSYADSDGIVCIPPVRGEQPAAARLQTFLAEIFGEAWRPATLPLLLDQAGFSGKSLEHWLRNGFFEQHCDIFHKRPFIWHIWDGRQRDGFAALVNYHKLERRLLERLTYAVLGDWISQQRHGVEAGELGAEDRLAAAETLQKKLALILEGEPPYDIFVRWKPLDAQPIGWDPDLNDGVRLNIRPFVEAGVLRKNPRIKWTKDRGGEPASLRPKEQFPWFWKDGEFTGERVNDVHFTNAEKRTARAAGGR